MKEWKGFIEKEFTITHYIDMKVIDGKRTYYIELNSDGRSSAKTPPLFLEEGEEKIPNDYASFLTKMRKILTTKE